ncbi:hypothetical protein HNP46_006484 [Pseudomonas nitritireducens]|uniref:YiaAB two helix domain-containing protein n=1 Tax=Pseudomonas nitroreducens TaxID=46680 RepID=A0A7W7KS55_PSENT|nr:hypothetical protein [Pseudomonas nitritireducens]MBB4867570.1 hypothetical protein [Pseudomonas nitritireducens]
MRKVTHSHLALSYFLQGSLAVCLGVLAVKGAIDADGWEDYLLPGLLVFCCAVMAIQVITAVTITEQCRRGRISQTTAQRLLGARPYWN